MKSFVTVGILCCGLSFGVAQQTVRLNNKDANMPIYLFEEGNLAPVSKVYVEVRFGFPGGGMTSSPVLDTEDYVFPVTIPGYFDAGLGSLGLAPEGMGLAFQLRAWLGAEGFPPGTPYLPLSYQGADVRGETPIWYQHAGDPILHIPSSIVLDYAPHIPEPATVTYGVIGAATLLTNGLMKTLKRKSPTSTNAAPAKVTLVSTNAPASAKTK